MLTSKIEYTSLVELEELKSIFLCLVGSPRFMKQDAESMFTLDLAI